MARRPGGKAELSIHGGEHQIPNTEAIDVYLFRGHGPGLMKLLYQQVRKRNIPVAYDTRATNLITNTKGEVIGVKARQPQGKVVNIRAHRAVILTTGGFEFNEQMKLQYLKVYPCYFTGSPALTGDGINMALEVGTQLWHMNCCVAGFVMKLPGLAPGITLHWAGTAWSPKLWHRGPRSQYDGLPAQQAIVPLAKRLHHC